MNPISVADLMTGHKDRNEIIRPFTPRNKKDDDVKEDEIVNQLDQSDKNSIEIDPFSPREDDELERDMSISSLSKPHKKKRGSRNNKSNSKVKSGGQNESSGKGQGRKKSGSKSKGDKSTKGVTQIVVNNYVNINLDVSQ